MTGHRAAAAPDASADLDPVEALAEEFLTRRRAGERPTVEEYAARHPDLAERIRAFFPALGLVEDLKPATLDHTGSLGGAAVPGRGGPLERLGDYRILREVGRGGMGVVYEAEQESLGRRVALKVLAASTLLDPKQLLRFHREAKAAARLHHTNIVPVFGVGEHDGLHYYVMQFIPGRGLDEVLEEVRRLRPTDPNFSLVSPAGERSESAVGAADSLRSPAGETGLTSQPGSRYVREVARLGVQAAEALEYAHAQGVLHRDVKPSNLLLDSHGTLWVTDFGLAKASDSADLTHTGDIVGTVRYMAPERFQGRCDARSDVYALGLTLYELLAQRPAFAAADRHTLMDQVTRGAPAPLRRLAPGIPRDLETIMHKAIERDPAHRYATAGELAADLRRFLEDRPVAARPAGPVERLVRWGRRNPVVAGLTAAVFALLATVAVGSALMAAQVGQKADEARAEAVAAGQARDAQAEARQAAEKAKAEVEKANAALRATEGRLRRTLYAAQLNLAQNAWEASSFRMADELLDQVRPAAGEPDLRGWEWHFLHRRLHPERLALNLPWTGQCYAVAGDGSLVAAQLRNTIKLYGTATGRELRTIDGATPGPSIVLLALSGDGKRLAAKPMQAPTGEAPTLRVWDTASGREVFSAPIPGQGSTDPPTFSPDGRRLLLSLGSGQTRVWDLEAGKELTVLPARSARFSPDGARIAGVAGPEATAVVNLWDAATGRELLTFDGPLGKADEVAFSPDDRQVAAPTMMRAETIMGTDRNAVAVWDAATGRRLHTLTMPAQPDGLEYTADGRRLVAAAWFASGPMRVAVWDANSGQAVHTLTGGPSRNPTAFSGVYPRPLAVSRDGARLAGGDATGTVTVWDAATGQRRRTLTGYSAPVTRMTFTPDGRSLVTISRDGQVRVWDVTGTDDPPIITLAGGAASGGRSGQQVALAPDGERVVALDRTEPGGYRVTVWNAADGREVFTAAVPGPGTGRSQGQMAFSQDGRRLATSQGPRLFVEGRNQGPIPESDIKVWDLTAGRELSTVRRVGGGGMTLSPDGAYLALSTNVGVRVVEAAAGREVWAVAELGGPMVFSPDGQRLLVGSKLLDAATGRERSAIPGAVSSVTPALSPDGRRLATAGNYLNQGSTIKVWNADTGRELLTFGGIGSVYHITFSPDGRRLAAVGAAESPGLGPSQAGKCQVKVWDAETGRELLSVPIRLGGRELSLAFHPDGHKLIVAGLTADHKPAVEVLDGTPR